MTISGGQVFTGLPASTAITDLKEGNVMAGEITYCDDYEAITGKKIPPVETKVIAAPASSEVAPATVAETPEAPAAEVA